MHDSAIKRVTSLVDARRALTDIVPAPTETATLPLARADGRVLARDAHASDPAPPEPRTTAAGVAVHASATLDAGERTPVRLRESAGPPDEDEATPVSAGEPLPDGATAVVPNGAVETAGGEISVTTPVAEGQNVADVGSDIEPGDPLVPAGTRLTPALLGTLATAGHGNVACYVEPTVGVVPVGRPERVTATGRTLAGLVARWGGHPEARDPVEPESHAVRPALQRDLTRDVIVTVGGTEAGDESVVPGVVDTLGERLVHGVAMAPGRATTLGVVEETPVVSIPGTVVGSLVAATQLVRPALEQAGGGTLSPIPTTEAQLTGKLASVPGERTFARVTLDDETATPVATGAATRWSTVASADGWVAVPEASEGYDAGESVTVERWEL
ncbi:molybdopterin molybdotransferase MoeA [Halosegnis longus]|uniref:Molybdopterin molybdenumtransferase MoeA n=1 Tax=Halosegnis longus TaxID=2216012 RepID=A0AAJ4R9W2_9EURY|nr:molybdopterin molybdotransferase MoeA [Halosegnis longus]RNJ26822.1 molybdopterin molybdenumtransferase MoeA [Salella cibi]